MGACRHLRSREMVMLAARRWLCLAVAAACALNVIPVAADRAATLEDTLERAYEVSRADTAGKTAQYIPALASAAPDQFGIAIVLVDGTVLAQGDTDRPFAIMSAAKPFTLALLLEQGGPELVLQRIGVEPTGKAFNALDGLDRRHPGPINPMVNAGAITAVSLLQADSAEQRWSLLLDAYSAFAGEPLKLMDDVYASVKSSNYHNRALANLLQEYGWLGADPVETLDVYNRQSCVAVTARQLATMGATLANGGVNPVTRERVLAADHVDEVLSVMMLSGFYDESGRWAYRAGLPAKSGVGGGIVAIVPGKMAIAAFSPRLNSSGNSVRAALAIEYIADAQRLGLFETRR